MNAAADDTLPIPRVVRLLVVDDSELDFELLLATLQRERMSVEARRIEERLQLLEALAEARWDAVISEHALPGLSSSEALQAVRESGQILPFIIVAREIGEDNAVASMREGADDCLLKSRLARLAPALLNALSATEARRERIRAQQALEDSEQRLRELLAHLEAVVDEERTAIAREVHDDIGGTLTALRFDLAWIERNGDPASAERASRAIETLAQAVQSAQRIQRNLRPPILDAGLMPALHWKIADFGRRTGISVTFESNVEELEVDTEVARTVYRTLQESLVNVAKHAHASKVSVSLVAGHEELSLEIVDDGEGIADENLAKPNSFGLRGLRERARRVGGWLEITRNPAGGTIVLLSIPQPPSPDAASGGASSQ